MLELADTDRDSINMYPLCVCVCACVRACVRACVCDMIFLGQFVAQFTFLTKGTTGLREVRSKFLC